ncbi:hypothetical protein [Halorussus caseinilyticus]|uniref:Uncharacterized protein n=1 Tax=Halorussus caseinilyticus TaxID=3034025 RepID=A0ABD5WS91_9EURY
MVQSENKTLWAKNLHLAPGEHEFIGIVVYSDSPAGTHEINATAAFLHDGNYTRESSVSNVTIPDFSSTTEPTTSPLPSPWVPLAAIVDWLEDNWVWLIPFFSLVVAVLSFFGYERVRGVLADERKADERGE